MSEKAFPELQTLHTQQDRYGELNGFDCESVGGMTLRDYFAAKAMQLAVWAHPTEKRGALLETATWAYDMADAMLKAREQGEQS